MILQLSLFLYANSTEHKAFKSLVTPVEKLLIQWKAEEKNCGHKNSGQKTFQPRWKDWAEKPGV